MPQAAPPSSPLPASGFSEPRRDWLISIAIALLALVVYNANWRVVSSGDNFPARYLPFAVLGYGTLYLDPIESVVNQGRAQHYWIVPGRNGRLVSQYPIVTPLLVTPLYLPAIAYLHVRGWTDDRMDRLARLMEKISASVIAAASAALMYLLLRRRADARTAALLAGAYAFGTNTWMIGSQGLWQHGMGELLLTCALLLVTGPGTAPRAFAAGAVCALAVFNRPPDAMLAAAVGAYGFCRAGRKAAAYMAAGAVAPAALLLAYNIGVVGHVAGGYAIAEKAEFFRFGMPAGVAGMLFSPGRGLFVFTPFLIALPLGLRRVFGDRNARGLSILICAAFVIQVAVYAKTDWRGGSSWGPRYLTDALPLLVWLLAPVVAGMRRRELAAFGAAVAVSVAIQAIGAFWYTGKSDEAMASTSGDPARMNAAWNLVTTPFLYELRHLPASRDLLIRVAGRIESVTVAGLETGEAPAGSALTVSGWTLAANRTPSVVVVRLLPGANMAWTPGFQYPVARIRTFTLRPDVSKNARPNARAGWSATLATDGLPPGNYLIEVTAQGGEGGEYRPVELRPFVMTGSAAGNGK